MPNTSETKEPILNLDEVTLINTIMAQLGLKTTASREFLRVCLANARLFDKKQLDYGPKNISGFGSFGIVVRMNDKFERLKTLLSKKRRRPQNESIMDSFRDLSNYANIAILLEEDRWPNE